jgi:hypothetical protein
MNLLCIKKINTRLIMNEPINYTNFLCGTLGFDTQEKHIGALPCMPLAMVMMMTM